MTSHSHYCLRNFAFGVLAVILIKLWLIAPQEFIARFAPHDDTLFLNLSLHILNGDWLGPYDQLTLIKGAGYPLFIAFSNFLGIPLIFFQELLYLGACFLFIYGLMRLKIKLRYLWLAFGILAFNPFSYNFFPNVYLFRFGIYPSVSLLIFGLAQLILIAKYHKEPHGVLLFVFGLVLGWFWNIREESIWIVPSLVVLSLAYIFLDPLRGQRLIRKKAIAHGLIAAVWAALGFLSVHGMIAYQNFTHYGVFTTNEMKSAAFKSAYGGLLRIETDTRKRRIPVNREAREIAYRVSPSFKELEHYFERGRGRHTWMGGGSDYMAAYFPWAFRDAIYVNGYFRDAPSTHEYLFRIGEEIDKACEAALIQCRPRLTELAPKWYSEWNRLAVPIFLETVSRFFKFEGFEPFGPRRTSVDDDQLILNYKYVTGSRVIPQRPILLEEIPIFHRVHVQQRFRIIEPLIWIYRHLPQALILSCFPIIAWRLIRIFRGAPVGSSDALQLAFICAIFSYAFILTVLQVTSYSSISRLINTMYPIVLALMVSIVTTLTISTHSENSSEKTQ